MNSRILNEKANIGKLLTKIPGKIVIVTHVNPDGDAIGSSLALHRVLSNIGHTPTVITPNAYPDFLKWMPGNDSVLVFNNQRKLSEAAIKEAKVIFCLDFNDLKRVKHFSDLVGESKAYKILIDHHPDPDSFANCIYSDTSASATAELIYDFIVETGFRSYIDKETAICIFAGIMADTGCFSYNSSQPRTYEIVQDLLSYGFDKDRIYYNIYDNFSENRMRMLGYILNEKMEVFKDFNTVILSLTREDQKKYHFQPGDSEGFVNYPLSIKGIRFTAFFIEKEDHVKLSFRSKGNFSVNDFAVKHFNGGGHLNASGGEMYAPMDEALNKFRSVLPLYKDALNTNED